MIAFNPAALHLVPFPRSKGCTEPVRDDAFKVFYDGRGRVGTVRLVLPADTGASWRWSFWFVDGVPFWNDGRYYSPEDAAVALVRARLRAEDQAHYNIAARQLVGAGVTEG